MNYYEWKRLLPEKKAQLMVDTMEAIQPVLNHLWENYEEEMMRFAGGDVWFDEEEL